MSMPSSRLRFVLAAVVIAAGAAACSTDKARLAGACQVQRCVCAPGGWSPASAGGQSAVVWQPDGTASCPPGLELHLMKPPPGRVRSGI